MPLPDFTEYTVSTETIADGAIVRLERSCIRLPDGHQAQRDVIRHPGAAATLALTEDNSVLLVWQYRYPLREHLWEIPAGKIDAGEPPLQTAQRELLEETGYLADNWRSGAVIATCAGFCDEQIHLFEARGLRYKGVVPQAGEFIHAQAFPLADAVAMVTTGQIKDSKTVIALLFASSGLSSTKLYK